MPDCYEELHACLDPGTDDASLDGDSDGFSNLQEYRLDADPCLADTDADGCSDPQELMMGFDPYNYWDFYDVPVPAYDDPTPNGTRDRAVNLQDVTGVLKYVGTFDGDGGVPSASGVAYDSDKNGDTVKDGKEYDRGAGPPPNPPYDAGPPNGAVNLVDVVVVLRQVGLNCQ